MEESATLLYQKFLEIKNMGWIQSMKNNRSGIGYTFERLLGKKEENFCYPDFHGIEIKTKKNFANGFITLLSAVPDGDYLFPLDTIRETYGYPDKTFFHKKIFQCSIQNGVETKIKGKYFQLSVDKDNEKIYLVVLNHKNEIIDRSISWSFDWMKERLFLKIQYLAVIHANHRIVYDEEYFQYTKIDFYKLRDFETFLKLINSGVIRITFALGLYKSGPKVGQKHDHGANFEIHLKDITLLFHKWNISAR